MIKDNEWPSKLVFFIRFFAFSVFAFFVNLTGQSLFMRIDANPRKFIRHIILGIFCPYAYDGVIFARSNLTHAVTYSEHTTLAGISRMGTAVD